MAIPGTQVDALLQGTTITIPGCAVGTVYPIGVSRFLSTGTTATGIIGLV